MKLCAFTLNRVLDALHADGVENGDNATRQCAAIRHLGMADGLDLGESGYLVAGGEGTPLYVVEALERHG